MISPYTDRNHGSIPKEPESGSGGSTAGFIAVAGAQVMGARLALTVLSVGFTMYLARVLSTTVFALFVVYGIVCNLVRVFSDLGIAATGHQKIPGLLAAGDVEAVCGLIKLGLITRLIFSGICVAVAAICASWISRVFLKTDQYTAAVLFMLPGAFFVAVSDPLRLIAQSVGRFGLISISDLVSGMVMPFASIGLYLALGVNWYFIGMAFGPFLRFCMILHGVRHLAFGQGRIPGRAGVFRYSFPFCLRGYLRFAQAEGDKIITGILMPPAMLAGYGIARNFIDLLDMLGESVSGPSVVKLAQTRFEPPSVQSEAFTGVARFGVMTLVPPCLAVACAGPFLMSLYGGHKYYGFWPILATLAVGHAVCFMAKFYGNNMLFAVGEPQMTLAADGIPGIFNLFLSVLLIRTLGRWGIAWSQLLTYALAFLVSRLLLSKLIRTKIVLKDWVVLMKAFLPAAAVVVLAQTFTARLAILAVCMLAGAVLFAVLLTLSVSDSDRAVLESALPGSIRSGVNRFRELLSTV